MSRHQVLRLAAVLIVVLGIRPVAAQVITAEIAGVVTDNTGAVVPGGARWCACASEFSPAAVIVLA